MRIVVNAFALTRPRTGIGIYTQQLMEQLLRLDTSNEYLFYYGKRFSRELRVGRERKGGGLEGDGDSSFWKGWCRQRLKDAYFFSGATVSGCRLYHELHSFARPFLGKTVLTVHDLSAALFPETHPRVRAEIWRAEFPRRLKRADRIIAISEHTRRDLVEVYQVDPGTIDVVYYGCRPIFRPLERCVTEAAVRKMSIRFPYILYVGAIEPRKNIMRLVDAFHRLKRSSAAPHRLVLGGPLAWKSEGILRGLEDRGIPYHVFGGERAEEAGDAEVLITGFIPNELLPPLMNGADLFVFPSLYEGFGLPPLEAMACGTPVITSTASSLPEVVGSAGITVPPDDTEKLASEMERVLCNAELRMEMREKGIRQAARFSWEACAREVLRIYGEVAGESRKSVV